MDELKNEPPPPEGIVINPGFNPPPAERALRSRMRMRAGWEGKPAFLLMVEGLNEEQEPTQSVELLREKDDESRLILGSTRTTRLEREVEIRRDLYLALPSVTKVVVLKVMYEARVEREENRDTTSLPKPSSDG